MERILSKLPETTLAPSGPGLHGQEVLLVTHTWLQHFIFQELKREQHQMTLGGMRENNAFIMGYAGGKWIAMRKQGLNPFSTGTHFYLEFWCISFN